MSKVTALVGAAVMAGGLILAPAVAVQAAPEPLQTAAVQAGTCMYKPGTWWYIRTNSWYETALYAARGWRRC